jgi:hypothetical protein
MKVIALVFLSIMTSIVVSYYLKPKNSHNQSTTPTTILSATNLDIGIVDENPEYIHKIELHNPSSKPILVDRFDVSCNCVSIEPESIEIPANDMASISLKLKLLSDVASGDSKELVVYNATITANNAGSPLGSWTVRGQIRRPFTFLKSSVTLRDHVEGSQPEVASAEVKSRHSLRKFGVSAPSWLEAIIEPMPGKIDVYQLKL